MKKTIRNIALGTTILLGTNYMIKKIKIRKSKKIVAVNHDSKTAIEEMPTYHTLGFVVNEKGKIKVKKEMPSNSEEAV